MGAYRLSQTGRRWTIVLGVFVAAAIAAGLGAVFSLRALDRREDRIASIYIENAMYAGKVRTNIEAESASARAFLLTGDESMLDRGEQARAAFQTNVAELRPGPERVASLHAIVAAEENYEAALQRAAALRRANAAESVIGQFLESDVAPAKDAVDQLVMGFAAREEQQLVDAERAAAAARERVLALVAAVAGGAVVVATVLAALLRRALLRLTHKQAALEESLVRVEQSNRDLDSFAGRVAHDVRAALSPVVMGSRVLCSASHSEAETKATLSRIDRSAQRAMALLDALLAFSRADQPNDRDSVASVRGVVASVLDQLETQRAQLQAVVEASIDDAQVQCPPGLLEIVVANVVGNAIKFLRGRPERRVVITTSTVGTGCELRVDDSGGGIPEEARERIFQPFYRVPGGTAAGTGIGLATVRRILDAHGGRISMHPLAGGGSSFRIWLPKARSDALSPVELFRPQPAIGVPTTRASRRGLA